MPWPLFSAAGPAALRELIHVSYLPFSLEVSVVSTPLSDSASVPVAIIGTIFSGLPNPHRGKTTNAHNTSDNPKKANTSGCKIQTPYCFISFHLLVSDKGYT